MDENHPHQSHESSSNSNKWRHWDNDQSQLPPFYEAHKETTNKSGEALNEDPHLIRYGIIYLINITVVEMEQMCRINNCHKSKNYRITVL